MAKLKKGDPSEMGMRTEQLTGRSQQVFFSAEESGNFTYPWAPEVDFDRQTDIDGESLTPTEVNKQIRALMEEGQGDITMRNPGAKHSLGVGILSRLNLRFEGSLGYFGCGLLDGPNVVITGRVGWSCAENMMSGTLVVKKMRVQRLEQRFAVVIQFAMATLGVVLVLIKKAVLLLWVARPVHFLAS